MRTGSTLTALGGLVLLGALAGTGLGQGIAERAGQAIDEVGRGVRGEILDVTDAVRSRFEAVRADVHRMGTQPRIYTRLHWDRALHDARIEVHMVRGGGVLLRGMVPDLEAKQRAVAIARDTVGVTSVIDELVVPGPLASEKGRTR